MIASLLCRSGRTAFLVADAFGDFAAVDRHVFWCIDTETYVTPVVDPEHSEKYVFADFDGFAWPSCENEHFCGSFFHSIRESPVITRTGETRKRLFRGSGAVHVQPDFDTVGALDHHIAFGRADGD